VQTEATGHTETGILKVVGVVATVLEILLESINSDDMHAKDAAIISASNLLKHDVLVPLLELALVDIQ
jgi:hypothetical protein